MFRRFERILRGLGSRLRDMDPDEVLRQAGARRGSAAGARAGSAGDSRPRPAPGGPSAEVQRAYANLELTPPASLDEAKTAWRRMMARYHPDRHQQDEKKAEIATKVAARLTEAYRIVREHLEAGAR